MPQNACLVENIEKTFGHNKVLKKINLELPKGKVTVLMGANGAGKSTLVKILSGVHQPDFGTIKIFDKIYSPASAAEALANGVVTVHQAINDGVIPDLDVASNLLLDRLAEPNSGFFVQNKIIREKARNVASKMKLNVDVTSLVSELGVADRQMIAIARAMAHKPKLLILDEPTSSLSAKEANRLFDLLETLKPTGVAILYISHRMSDIRRIADRIIAMRDGKINGIFETTNLDYEGAVTAMLGHKMTDIDVQSEEKGEIVLDLQSIKLKEYSAPINLQVHKNEVIAICGLLGSGKTQLASILFGLEKAYSGKIVLNKKDFSPRSPSDAIKSGVHMCPKDRASNALIPDFDITKNLTLPFLKFFTKFTILKPRFQKKITKNMIETLGIICQSASDNILTLSGGNQQKVMIARWLSQQATLLLLDEPFQGVDIQARRDIGHHVRQTKSGRATIVFAAELDEALEIADSIVIMHEKEIIGTHKNEKINLSEVMAQFSGHLEETKTEVG